MNFNKPDDILQEYGDKLYEKVIGKMFFMIVFTVHVYKRTLIFPNFTIIDQFKKYYKVI